MRSKRFLPLYALIAFLVAGLMGFYIFLRMDPSNQRFAQPPETLTLIAEFNHGALIEDVAFSPVNPSLIAGADADNTIKLWNLNNTAVPQAILSGHIGTVKSIAFSPNGELLASAGLDGRVILWDVHSATKINALEVSALTVAISPDGHYLVTASRHLQLWDIRNPKEVTEVETIPHDESVLLWTVDFSPDGKWLAYGDENGGLKVWDIQHQKLVRSLKADSDKILSVQFSADSRFLASTGIYRHTLWNLPEWKPHGGIIGEGIGSDFAFSSDSKMYATPDINGVVLRSAASGARIVSLKGTTATTWSVAFSPDGSMLASGGKDERLHLWNVSKQQLAKMDTSDHDIVRLIYFLSKERSPQRGISVKLDRFIRNAQRFYATQMKNNGFGRKTFTFETDEHGKAKVYLFKAQHPDDYYREGTIKKIRTEVTKHFDRSKNILLVAIDVQNGVFAKKGRFRTTGLGNVSGFTYSKKLRRALHGGRVFVSASNTDLDWDTIAHELGHAFGLQHDFRGRYPRIMSYANGRPKLSKCAAEWLDKSRFFNPNRPFFDKRATIEMLPLPDAADAIPLQFEITDEDGLHQVQLIVPTSPSDPVTKQGDKLHSCQSLNGVKKATVAFELPKTSVKEIELWMIDMHGNIVWREFDFSEKAEKPIETPSNRD